MKTRRDGKGCNTGIRLKLERKQKTFPKYTLKESHQQYKCIGYSVIHSDRTWEVLQNISFLCIATMNWLSSNKVRDLRNDQTAMFMVKSRKEK